jgi:uncharacterized membrane protein
MLLCRLLCFGVLFLMFEKWVDGLLRSDKDTITHENYIYIYICVCVCVCVCVVTYIHSSLIHQTFLYRFSFLPSVCLVVTRRPYTIRCNGYRDLCPQLCSSL